MKICWVGYGKVYRRQNEVILIGEGEVILIGGGEVILINRTHGQSVTNIYRI